MELGSKELTIASKWTNDTTSVLLVTTHYSLNKVRVQAIFPNGECEDYDGVHDLSESTPKYISQFINHVRDSDHMFETLEVRVY